jgi:CDP-diacylglycerol--glycerol-3-phosphate 3-phosphatidyltransferase
MKKKHIPNFLTILRIVLVPFFIAGFFASKEYVFQITFGIFLFASLTDLVDGYLARRWKLESEFGKLFDPMADKILNIAALFMLSRIGFADVIACIIIAVREFCVPTIREYYSAKGVKFPTLKSAKYKTAFNMIAVLFLLYAIKNNELTYILIGNITLYLSATLAVLSGYFYIMLAQRQLNGKSNGKKAKKSI